MESPNPLQGVSNSRAADTGEASSGLPQQASTTDLKRFQCRHCKRRFRRHEHLQRHERTHTKDKPYRCQKCPQRFTRGDLLARHERLTHCPSHSKHRDQSTQTQISADVALISDEPGGGGETLVTAMTPASSPSPILSDMEDSRPVLDPFNPTTYSQPEHGCHDSFPLNALSMAAEQAIMEQLAPQDESHEQLLVSEEPRPPHPHPHAHPHQHPVPGLLSSCGFQEPQPEQEFITPVGFVDQLDFGTLTEWDNPLFTSYNVPLGVMTEQPMPLFSPDTMATDLPPHQGSYLRFMGLERSNTVPSSERANLHLPEHPPEGTIKYRPLSDVRCDQWDLINGRLKEFEHILPSGTRLPPRLMLSQFISAFMGGFHEHMPFLHFPTLTPENCPVELLIAIAATGAHYRFEHAQGVMLFNMGRAIVMEKLKHLEIDPPTWEPNWFQDVYGEGQGDETMTARSRHAYNLHQEESGMEPEDSLAAMQTLVLLMAIGGWAGNESISRKALGLQSILAVMVRQHGLNTPPVSDSDTWETWARAESAKRTKFIVFCYFNIQSLLYNIPSPIAVADIHLPLPCISSIFEARSEAEWERKRSSYTITEKPFQASFRRLFCNVDTNDKTSHSALGNYILIHALLQQIFYARQLDQYRPSDRPSRDFPGLSESLGQMEKALRNWQRGWRHNFDACIDLQGPISYNSIALLRLAYIRLNANVGPSRALETRNPLQVARALLNSHRPQRSPQLSRAITHSAYALSIPIKIGLKFVAQTQAIFWSIQHSLCSLECAVLLSAWLNSLAMQEEGVSPLTPVEKQAVQLVHSLLEQTEYGSGKEHHVEDIFHPAVLKRLSAGVVRVWSLVFEGPQTWPIVKVIGASLEIYAQLLEAD